MSRVLISVFRDLVTADGETIRAGTLVIIVVFSIKKGVEVIAYWKVTPVETLN